MDVSVQSQSQWPRGLRRETATVSLLGLWVRIPLSLVSVMCCRVEVSASGRSLVQRSSTDCGVFEFGREASTARWSWRVRGCCAMVRRYYPEGTEAICPRNFNTLLSGKFGISHCHVVTSTDLSYFEIRESHKIVTHPVDQYVHITT
jgi:hypothetical protein